MDICGLNEKWCISNCQNFVIISLELIVRYEVFIIKILMQIFKLLRNRDSLKSFIWDPLLEPLSFKRRLSQRRSVCESPSGSLAATRKTPESPRHFDYLALMLHA